MFLENINSPQDLKKLTLEQLPQVAEELRQRMVEVVASVGGHLASSLGAVELIIALHYCLNAPHDKIVFDVGHQAYAHKLLTGRNKNFSTLRQYQGVSGFPSKDESEYDVFTTGHSSNAVSLALGMACARDAASNSPEQFKVAAVIGDGSLSGGLCFEGLNNAGHLKKDIIVVLNTNELSIAPNVGALSNYLNKIISLPIYNRFKNSFESFVQSRMPHKGSRLIKLVNKFEEGLKGLFVPGMFFEEMGFRYFGPFDGHDIKLLVETFANVFSIKGPKIIHVVTKKGKGYPPAEKEPIRLHGTGPFDIETGEGICNPGAASFSTYTGVFSEKLTALAAQDEKIVAVTAAMPEGTGLNKFRDAYPQRFFDVGIAEAHAVSFAGGLARAGLKPVIAIYSTFLQRAYDQIIEDIALQNLGVVFAIDRAGIVGEDGVTHQGIFDIVFTRSIPGLIVMSPKDGRELEAMLEYAFKVNKPVAIRYPRACCPPDNFDTKIIETGKGEVLAGGKDFCVISLGSMTTPALEAVDTLSKGGLQGTLINARFVKPIDEGWLKASVAGQKNIFTIEEGIENGGFGSAVAQVLQRPVTVLGLPDEFIPHGKRELLLDKYGLSAQKIAGQIKQTLWQK